jgi:hypothetical protein
MLAITLQTARADVSDQKTVVTFSEPVEIPGQVLMPGTYVFKLADSDTDRDIVQVYDKEETHLYRTFITIPDCRQQPAGKTIISFDERPAGDPEALKAWFYPGDNYGREFVYPKQRAVTLASVNKKAPLKAQAPTGEEVEVAEAFAVVQAPASMPKALPETASSLPLIGLLGLLSLLIAVCLPKTAAKR